MRTSIQAEVGWLAQNQARTAASYAKNKSGPLEFGSCLCTMPIVAVTCFMDKTVCRTTRTWIRVTKFRGVIFRGSKTQRITPTRKIPAIP